MKKRIVRISPEGKMITLHVDGVDFERIGDVKIERATDVAYKTGAGWSARYVHSAYHPLGRTKYRKDRKEAIRDEEVALNIAIERGDILPGMM